MARYPDNLIQYVNWCGNCLLVRPVRPDDAPKFVTASLLCSAADLRFRFLRCMHRLSEGLAAQLTQIDYEQHMAFVVEGLKGDIMAVTRLVRDGCKKSAEYAIIVRSDLQKQGLGTLAQKLLLDYAASLGLKEVWGLMDTENRRALNLATKLGFSRVFQFGLPFVRVVKSLA